MSIENLESGENEYQKKGKKHADKSEELARVLSMEEKYFFDKDNLFKDLQNFADQLGKNIRTIHTAETGNIIYHNNKSVTWETFLMRAGKALGFGNDIKTISGKKSAILAKLKEIGGIIVRNERYYENKENVLYDLQNIANKNNKNIKDVLTIDEGEIVCANGEIVRWKDYLYQAGRLLGFVNGVTIQKSLVLEKLKKVAGIISDEYQERNESYYLNEENIFFDLNSFAKSLNKLPQDITTNDKGEFLCKNGDTVKWRTYVMNAGVALGFGSTGRHVDKFQGNILKKLKEIAGIEIKDFRPKVGEKPIKKPIKKPRKLLIDKIYCENKDNVLHDLQDIANKKNKTIHDLTANEEGNVLCKNGELLTRGVYLYNAGKALGLANNPKEAHINKAKTLLKLKEIAGIAFRDKAYYENKENVLHDLQDIAVKSDKSIYDVVAGFTGNIECSNGQFIPWRQYLREAGKALGFGGDLTSHTNHVVILEKLKEIAGIIIRDKNYYEDKNNILRDLQKFAAKVNKKPKELTVNEKGKISCSNGEIISWHAYVSAAARFFGLGFNRAMALKELIKIANITIRDKAYYENKENVLHDLQDIAVKTGRPIEQLSTYIFEEVLCQTGEKILWKTYLMQAGRALGFGESNRDLGGKLVDVLIKLREIAGFTQKEYLPRDKAYYENKENVLHDLQNMATKIGKSIKELSISSDKNIFCANGEILTWNTYLIQAGKALGFGLNTYEVTGKKAQVLEELKKIAGMKNVIRDKAYYENNLLKDLEIAAIKSGKTLDNLTSTNFDDFKCTNGDIIRWQSYIIQASFALGFVKSKKEGLKKIPELLKELKKYIGIEIKNYSLRDKKYYEQYLKHDLDNFATQLGKKTNELVASDIGDVLCHNGEKVRWGTYIIHVGMALGLGEGGKNIYTQGFQILQKLKKRLGYKIIEEPRDYQYYMTYLKHDLENFAKQIDKNVEQLTSADKGIVKCQNGDEVRWDSYIINAGKALGFGESHEVKSKQSETLKLLKKLIGVKIKEYSIRDKEYYNKYLKSDLEYAANIQGRHIEFLKANIKCQIVCQNGEMMSLQSYISQASIVLGFVHKSVDAASNLSELLVKLKSLIGIETRNAEERVEISNPSKYKDLARTLGRTAMMEIFIAHHPQYQDIPFAKLQKIVSDYLGKSAYVGGGVEGFFGGIDLPDVGIILAVPTLRETLLTAIKSDYLLHLIEYRKQNNFPINGYKEVYASWKEQIMPKIQNLYPDIGELMEEVESNLYEVFDNKYHSEDLVDELDESGREFPGFEQRYNIAEFIRKMRLLVADEMGLGKTATAICAKEHVKHEVKTAMVVCPANMIATWVERLGDGMAENGKPLGYFKPGKAPKVLIIESKKDLEKNFAEYDYIVMSSARLNDDNVSLVLEQDYQMLIVDEVHEVKNLTSGVWSRNLVRLSDKLNGSGYVMTLSGTPIPNTVKDIAIHMKILYPHEFDGIENRDIVASMMNQDKLNVGLKLRNKMSRKRLLDWIPMTERHDEVHFAVPTDFEESIMHMIVEDEEQAAMQKIQRLRKLAMCPQAINPEWEGKLSAKMVELGDFLVNELKKKDKIMIVFNDFIEDIIRSDDEIQINEEELIQSEGIVIDYITKRLKEAGMLDGIETLSYHGNVEQKKRQEIQSKINNESGKKLLFLSGNAARVGIDLSGIESVAIYNNPWTKSDLEQQISRVYRVGVKHDVDVHHFITSSTIEEGIWHFMHEKERVVRKLIDGREILTEEEKELLMSEDMTDMKGYHPDQEFAQYYYTQKEFLYEQFVMNKGIGEENFLANMNKLTRGERTRGERYAEVYSMLGHRNYQFNANRVNNRIISEIIKLEGEEMDINSMRILDMASGNQVLSKTATPELKPRITSNDINAHHFPSGDNIENMLQQDAYTNFASKEAEYMYGSMTQTLYDEESFDIVNCSLAWHYTALNDGKDVYDRVDALIEANRVLKQGGYMIINEIYSLEFAEREKLIETLKLFGFEIVDHLTGLAVSQHDSTFKSNILTIRKIGPAKSRDELLEKPYKKVVLQGLRFQATKQNGIYNQSKILEAFTLNDKSYNISLNVQDYNLKTEESNAFELIKSLKELYRDENSKEDPILNVPESTLHSNGMFSFIDKSSDGKKIRRVARKLSDGSFIFVN